MQIQTRLNMMPAVILIGAILVASMFMMPALAGNGAPSGKHFTLNLLGKNWQKGDYALIMDPEDPNYNPATMDNNGHRIFVKLDGKTRILLMPDAPLSEGGTFNVIDADGTDGKAIFQMPNPECQIVDGPDADSDPDTLQYAAYSVYIRVLGKPEGWAQMTSGFYDPATDTTWMSLESIILKQDYEVTDNADGVTYVYRTPPPKFSDVTKQLLTIYVDVDADGMPERFGIFDDALMQYFWDYDNNGLRHVQLRFYEIAWGTPA